MKYFILLFLISCSEIQKKIDADAPTNHHSELKKLLLTSQDNYPLKGWHEDYSKVIELSVKDFPISVPCDNPVLFWQSVALPESAFNRRSTYNEPAPLNYQSLGLLQLSLEDESWAHCGFKTKQDVYHPIRNLYCGVKILNMLQTKHAGKSIYWQGGQYWSVLRNPENWPNRKNYNGLKAFKENIKKGGCDI